MTEYKEGDVIEPTEEVVELLERNNAVISGSESLVQVLAKTVGLAKAQMWREFYNAMPELKEFHVTIQGTESNCPVIIVGRKKRKVADEG